MYIFVRPETVAAPPFFHVRTQSHTHRAKLFSLVYKDDHSPPNEILTGNDPDGLMYILGHIICRMGSEKAKIELHR